MSRRTTALAAALSLLVFGAPLITGCSDFAGNIAWRSAEQKFEKGDFKGAIADYTKAIEINPQYADAYNNRGAAKYSLKDTQGAIADYNKAIEINPQLALAYYNRGNAKHGLRDQPGACADYKKAVSLGDQGTAQWLNSEGGAWCRNMR